MKTNHQRRRENLTASARRIVTFRRFNIGSLATLAASLALLASCADFVLNRLRSQCEESAETVIYDPKLWAGYVRAVNAIHHEGIGRGVNVKFNINPYIPDYELVHSQEFYRKTKEWKGDEPDFDQIVSDDVLIYFKNFIVAKLKSYTVKYKTFEQGPTGSSCLIITPHLYIERQRNA